MLVRTLLALLPFLMLADGETTGGEEDTDTDATADRDDADGTNAEDTLGDKGQKALRREREARKVAEKERTDLQKRVADFEKRQREADEANAKAQRKKNEEAGKFDEVKQSLESERDTAASERDRFKEQNDTLLRLVKADVEAAWGDLPDEVKDAYDGEDDDVLAKKQHMQRMAKVIAKLTDAVRERKPGHPRDPKTGINEIDINTEVAKKAASYRI